jgi:hypothetical protein
MILNELNKGGKLVISTSIDPSYLHGFLTSLVEGISSLQFLKEYDTQEKDAVQAICTIIQDFLPDEYQLEEIPPFTPKKGKNTLQS